MTEETFNVGSVVALKSGGPSMTVEAVDQQGVHCVWWEGARQRAKIFPLEALTIASQRPVQVTVHFADKSGKKLPSQKNRRPN